MIDLFEFMAADHNRLDNLLVDYHAAQRTDQQRARELFDEFRRGLERRIGWEEEILYPLFEKRGGFGKDGVTAVLRQEHQAIKRLMAEIADKWAKGDLPPGVSESPLDMALAAHDLKEETVIYPTLGEMLSRNERKKALAKLWAHGLPEDSS